MNKNIKDLNLCKNNNLFSLDYPIKRIISNIKCIRIRVKAIIERAKYGISEYDSWDFDHYLMAVIENGVKFLRDAGNSYPGWCSYEDWQRKLVYIIKLSELANLSESELTLESFNKYENSVKKYGKHSEESKKAKDEWIKDEESLDELKATSRRKVLKEIEKYIDDLWD